MNNKPLASKLLSKIKDVRAEHAVNNNSIFSLQKQVSALFDIVELVISDENVTMSAPDRNGNRYASTPYQGGHVGANPAGYDPVFRAQDRPPTVDEAETMEIPATQATQVFMTARGTKVVPPAYLGMRPFTIGPGESIPSFPSLEEYQRNQGGPARVAHPPGYQVNPSYVQGYQGYDSGRGGQGLSVPGGPGGPGGYVPPPGYALVAVGTPSNPTVPGQSPAGAPPGLQSGSMPAVGHVMAVGIPQAPYEPVTSVRSVQLSGVGIPDSLAHMVEGRNMILEQPVSGGARNITNSDGSLPGQPQNMYPGGQVVTG